MRRIIKVDINESVLRNKLIFHEEWLDKFDRIIIYLLFVLFIVAAILTIIDSNFENQNDKFISLIILPLGIFFALYVVYRKATEKHLQLLITPFDKKINKQIVLNYAHKHNLLVYRKSTDLIILNNSSNDINQTYKKSLVFILRDNQLLFTILKDQFKLNFPILFSHITLRKELNKFINSFENR